MRPCFAGQMCGRDAHNPSADGFRCGAGKVHNPGGMGFGKDLSMRDLFSYKTPRGASLLVRITYIT